MFVQSVLQKQELSTTTDLDWPLALQQHGVPALQAGFAIRNRLPWPCATHTITTASALKATTVRPFTA